MGAHPVAAAPVGAVVSSARSLDAREASVRALRGAEYILRLQDENGAIRDAHDSGAVNMDNNMGYSMVGLAAAYWATGNERYLAAIRRGLSWLASVQEADGAWHWGYLTPQYRPFVGEQYARQGIYDIRGVDAIQAYFAYVLYLYVRLSGDAAFGASMLPTAQRGVDFLVRHSYDGQFFFSSWQWKRGRWIRLREQFSAGQADVYLGLMALHRLGGGDRYAYVASRLADELPVFYRNGAWIISLYRARPYPFSNGYLPYVFLQANGLDWLAAHQDGSAIAAASLAIGARANGVNAGEALATLADLQESHGGVGFRRGAPGTRPAYSNDTGFAVLAWLGAPFAGLHIRSGPGWSDSDHAPGAVEEPRR